jgi:hypothetical protein
MAPPSSFLFEASWENCQMLTRLRLGASYACPPIGGNGAPSRGGEACELNSGYENGVALKNKNPFRAGRVRRKSTLLKAYYIKNIFVFQFLILA